VALQQSDPLQDETLSTAVASISMERPASRAFILCDKAGRAAHLGPLGATAQPPGARPANHVDHKLPIDLGSQKEELHLRALLAAPEVTVARRRRIRAPATSVRTQPRRSRNGRAALAPSSCSSHSATWTSHTDWSARRPARCPRAQFTRLFHTRIRGGSATSAIDHMPRRSSPVAIDGATGRTPSRGAHHQERCSSPR
jgi:hypothetical protein